MTESFETRSKTNQNDTGRSKNCSILFGMGQELNSLLSKYEAQEDEKQKEACLHKNNTEMEGKIQK